MEIGGDDAKKRKLDQDEQDHSNKTHQLTEEELRKLLEPLNKEQLISLLLDAGSQYVAVAEEIRDVASKDPVHRKLFVRGLSWETTSQTLRDVFAQYGEIEEGAVIVDKTTNKSRGFGFITFKHMESAQKALREPSKTIDGRLTVCNLATSGTSNTVSSGDISQRKLYIGGLSYDTTSETVIKFFSQYGEIEEGAIAYERNSNKSRGFAFVTFKSAEAAKKAIDDSSKIIEGRHVTVKLAMEGQKEKPASSNNPQSGVLMPHVQHAFNPSFPNYPRPQIAPQAGAGLGLNPYSPGLAYAGQPSYPAIPPSQYGPVMPGTSQQYPQYGFQGQPGQPAPYYGGAH